MQNLLGKHYKWFYIVYYYLKANTYYFWNEVFNSLFQTFGLITVLIIFINQNQSDKQLLTYLIIGNAFYALTNGNVVWWLGYNIKDGKLSKYLLLPTDFFGYHIAASLQNCVYLGATQFVSLIPIIFLFYLKLDFNSSFILFLPICFLVSWFIRFCLDIITASGSFWFTEISGLANLIAYVSILFSGSLFPIEYFGPFKNLVSYSPFAYTFYHPMQIYLGNYNSGQIGEFILVGLIWCIVLWILTKKIFKFGLKRYESVGL